ncbi:hypothetical protein SISSUDRAFT_305773 [Sistotremastrum suecicum HHB10207 ss-3]|uniref:ER transporter 6TM N-terminal domain-containing protein n=1 Tax=Sistotremastrum suecicum HHB10207 ss-3 TaxID=1314776 RepID=A0A166G7Q3_9AGAM|nr:hypothetical protein SISSUDRAFT_305773 [Sistotremastrum suecicum HHB10207 ss-3]
MAPFLVSPTPSSASINKFYSSSGSSQSSSEGPSTSYGHAMSSPPPASPAKLSTTESILERLPPWVSLNIASWHSWKLLLRCWLASWCAFVLILPGNSLLVMGNAAFFAFMTSLIIPPNMPAQLFAFVVLTSLLGCLFGWGFGAVAMRASLALRNTVTTASAILMVQTADQGNSNPDAVFNKQVFQGVFLETGPSAMFGLFLAIGTAFAACLRAYYPNLAFMSLFLTIFIDIFTAYGPLFPIPHYLLLNSFMISTAMYSAIAIACVLVIFPETLSHQWLNGGVSLVKTFKKMIDIQEEVFAADFAGGDLIRGAPLYNKVLSNKEAFMKGFQSLTSKTPMLSLEFRYGKWSGDDVKALEAYFGRLGSKMVSLQTYSRLVGQEYHRQMLGSTAASTNSIMKLGNSSSASLYSNASVDSYVMRHMTHADVEAEAFHHIRTQDIAPLLREATAELRAACVAALNEAEEVLRWSNSRKTKLKQIQTSNDPEHLEQSLLHEETIKLRKALTAFKESAPKEILKPFSPLLGLEENTGPKVPLRALFLSVTFSSNLIWAAESIVELLEKIELTRAKRTKNHFWLPKGLRDISHILTMHDEDTHKVLGERSSLAKKGLEQSGYHFVDYSSYQLDPDSSPPRHFGQRVGAWMHKGMEWMHTREAIFVMKYVFISVALWLPSIFKSSAFFAYANRAVWAQIMAQTTLTVTMSEQVYAYFSRVLATLIGLLAGLAAWYTASGSGDGNPYSLAVVVGIVLIPIMFVRVHSPYPMETLIMGLTFALIVGYSWIDGHLELVADPGVGWNLAWRRFLLVVLGCAAGFVIMLFPSVSSRELVRVSNANCIREISELYTSVVAAWMFTDEIGKTEEEFMAIWSPKFRGKLLSTTSKLYGLRAQTKMAKWEGSMRGNWQYDEYARLVEVQIEMTGALAQLSGALHSLPMAWRRRLLHRTRFLNPNFIADVIAVLSAVSQCLKSGDALHQVLPSSLTERIFYHDALAPSDSKQQESPNDLKRLAFLESVEFMSYATAVCAVCQLMNGIDETHQIAKRLCGEIPLNGYAHWKEDWDRAHFEF